MAQLRTYMRTIMLYLASDQLLDEYRQGDLPSFAESAGYILGAAMCCSDIDRSRIFVATDRIKEIVAASSTDSMSTMCDAAFHEGFAAGAKAIGCGDLDRLQANAALSVLERMIGH